MHSLQIVVCGGDEIDTLPWLPLTRELSPKVTEGEKNIVFATIFSSLPPSFAYGKIHLPRQREARGLYIPYTPTNHNLFEVAVGEAICLPQNSYTAHGRIISSLLYFLLHYLK